jgi:hypothetical protein
VYRFLFHAASVGARLRGARLMHPRGRAFRGTLVVAGQSDPGPGYGVGSRLLDGAGRHRVTVRLSKATPTPSGWPDVFGVAIRLGRRRGHPVDLLLTSSNPRPFLRHLFLPSRTAAAFYSSLAAYRTDRFRRLFLGARVDPGGRTATLAVATRFSRWYPVARLTLGRRLTNRSNRRLAFNPVRHTPPDLSPVGWIHRMRDPVYRGSQHGRRGR